MRRDVVFLLTIFCAACASDDADTGSVGGTQAAGGSPAAPGGSGVIPGTDAFVSGGGTPGTGGTRIRPTKSWCPSAPPPGAPTRSATPAARWSI